VCCTRATLAGPRSYSEIGTSSDSSSSARSLYQRASFVRNHQSSFIPGFLTKVATMINGVSL
jgi:hypothetical protein